MDKPNFPTALQHLPKHWRYLVIQDLEKRLPAGVSLGKETLQAMQNISVALDELGTRNPRTNPLVNSVSLKVLTAIGIELFDVHFSDLDAKGSEASQVHLDEWLEGFLATRFEYARSALYREVSRLFETGDPVSEWPTFCIDVLKCEPFRGRTFVAHGINFEPFGIHLRNELEESNEQRPDAGTQARINELYERVNPLAELLETRSIVGQRNSGVPSEFQEFADNFPGFRQIQSKRSPVPESVESVTRAIEQSEVMINVAKTFTIDHRWLKATIPAEFRVELDFATSKSVKAWVDVNPRPDRFEFLYFEPLSEGELIHRIAQAGIDLTTLSESNQLVRELFQEHQMRTARWWAVELTNWLQRAVHNLKKHPEVSPETVAELDTVTVGFLERHWPPAPNSPLREWTILALGIQVGPRARHIIEQIAHTAPDPHYRKRATEYLAKSAT